MGRLILPFLLLAAVVGATLLSDRPAPRADFTFINRGDVTTLDVQRMSWMQDLRVCRFVFEGLCRLDVFDWDYPPVPGVAERWEVSGDKRTYTFHLRAGARWSNGEPVTSEDFLFSWRRAMLPDVASDYISLFQLIEGAAEFYDWRTRALADFKPGDDATALWKETEEQFRRLVRLDAPDDRTLRVTLLNPTPYFLDLCAFPTFSPVYPPLVRQYDVIDPATARIKTLQGWTKPPLLVSNGPFRITRWRFKRDMRFEPNPFYWDRSRLNIDSVAVVSNEDPNAQVLAFTGGGVDWVSDVTVDYKADMLAQKKQFYAEHKAEYDRLRALGLDQFEIDRRLPADPRACIHPVPAFGTYFYNFNCLPKLADGRANPFADARVRRAFAMAVDKHLLVDEVRRSGEPVATTMVPPHSIAGYESPVGLPYDPAAARALLIEAGYQTTASFPTVELLFNKDGGHDLTAAAVAKMWERNLGVHVTLAQKEIKVFRDDLKKQNYMISRAGWYGDYGDPTTFLDLSRTGDGNNDRKYSCPEYDDLLREASHEPDPKRRMQLLHDAERIITERDLPMLPLYHYITFYLFDPHKVSGINPHPRTTQMMDLVDILGDGKGAERALAMPARPVPGAAP
ncbi:MAG: peptide ABC transporter substrate-binding protein [Phycisphaerales bacterium]|nr:peptide ABC transporter substrate-binding protein [Phycisphaerales bacterium]